MSRRARTMALLAAAGLLAVAGAGLYLHEEPACDDAPPSGGCPAVMVHPYRTHAVAAGLAALVAGAWAGLRLAGPAG